MHYKNFLFWGNNKNMTYFLPDEAMNDHPVSDKVVITQLEVDNKSVEIGQKVNDQVILEKGIPYTNEFTLTAANNNFSLMFSNLTYSDELQKYSYRLTPAQSDWLIAADGERVSYANLPPGEYLFEVSSIMPDGSNGNATSMVIHILPFWYETAWFRFLIATLAAFLIYYLIRRVRREQARLRQEERLKHELFVSNLEREKEKQINRERGNFFTNVSHELRTPLTLILSPLQELLQTERLSETLHDKLSLVYNNATSLSTLVNQLLYVQKIEAGMVQLHLSKVEIVALVEHVMSSFRHMAEIKSTEYVLNSGIFFTDPDRYEMLHPPIETHQLPVGYQPKQAVIRLTDMKHLHIKAIRTEVLYIFPVIAAQPVVCTEPHETVPVLMNAGDRIISQSILHGKYPNVLFKESIAGKTIKDNQ